MITFHPQRLDCARRVSKNEGFGTFNFTPQIALSICTVAFTKREKSDATIFTSRCSRLSLICNFRHGHALPLSQAKVFRLARSSPMIQRNPVRRLSNNRKPSGQTPDEKSRGLAAQLPGKWPDSGGSNATERPARLLARQLVLRRTWIRNARAGNLRDNSRDGRATTGP